MNIKTFWPLLFVLLLAGIINCNSLNQSAQIGKDFYHYLQSGEMQAVTNLLDDEALKVASVDEWEQRLTANVKEYGELKSFRRSAFKMTDDEKETLYILDFKVTYEKKILTEQLTFVKRGDVYKLLHYQVLEGSFNEHTTPNIVKEDNKSNIDTMKKIQKTAEEWRKELNEMEYSVLREAGTERPFTGEYYEHDAEGTYHCRACGHALFNSTHKYHSGCGWPSFWSELETADIKERVDKSHGMTRVELLCSSCESHLGHKFDDGPPPSGIRYCINSVCLKFVPKK